MHKTMPKIDAQGFLGQWLDIVIDRPLGSFHPSGEPQYPINYGYVPDTLAGDGFEQDAYILGVSEPISKYHGYCAAVIQRADDVEDKLVIVPDEVFAKTLSNEAILKATNFIEQYFVVNVIRVVSE